MTITRETQVVPAMPSGQGVRVRQNVTALHLGQGGLGRGRQGELIADSLSPDPLVSKSPGPLVIFPHPLG